jgi:hypothetical protein
MGGVVYIVYRVYRDCILQYSTVSRFCWYVAWGCIALSMYKTDIKPGKSHSEKPQKPQTNKLLNPESNPNPLATIQDHPNDQTMPHHHL